MKVLTDINIKIIQNPIHFDKYFIFITAFDSWSYYFILLFNMSLSVPNMCKYIAIGTVNISVNKEVWFISPWSSCPSLKDR